MLKTVSFLFLLSLSPSLSFRNIINIKMGNNECVFISRQRKDSLSLCALPQKGGEVVVVGCLDWFEVEKISLTIIKLESEIYHHHTISLSLSFACVLFFLLS
jgi:hypothetical protein